MTVQTDVLHVLKSADGKKALTAAGTDALESAAGQKALKKAVNEAVATALESATGQKALKLAVQDQLRQGFAELAPNLPAAQAGLVHPNQQWLFDTVDNMSSLITEVFNIVVAGNKKVPS